VTDKKEEAKTSTKKSAPVIEVAKEQKVGGDSNIVVLSTGVKAKISAVASNLIDKVTARYPDPDVPMFYNEDKERDEPNPADPDYLKAKTEATKKRGEATIDAMILFGVELVDGMPEDESWLTKLQYLEKIGQLDLSEYDLEDPMEREFIYKKLVVIGTDDIFKILTLSGVSEEAVRRQMESFQGEEVE
jgi:hypothetical protein